MNSQKPTLLVFTLGAAGERARRPWLPGDQGRAELELRQALLASALAAGREVGCRLEVSMPARAAAPALAADVRRSAQTGRGFGDRLERACQAAAGSPGPLLVVGTDIPGLTAGHLRSALDAVADDPDQVVLGPSPDGGFYLLASARPLPGLAAMTCWCRPDTLARLRRSLRAAGRRVMLLEPLADLDHRRDLERWIASAPSTQTAAATRPAARESAPAGSRPQPASRPASIAQRRHPAPLFGAWRTLLRRLARLLADLRRPLSVVASPRLRPAVVPVRSPRAPPRRRR